MTEKDIYNICKQYNIKNYSINEDLSIDVDGNVNLFNKGLTKLPLKFNKVNGNFECFKNNLTSLEGAPNKVTGYFNCAYNQLTSLEGAPKEVNGHFGCYNNKLTSLEVAPKEVNGNFYCSNNELTSLEYLPDIKGELYFDNNPISDKFKGKSVRQIRNYYKLKHILND
jgi:hypothetical protein